MEDQEHDDALLISLTDGYGRLPDGMPKQELLWVLVPESKAKDLEISGVVCRMR